MWSFVFANKWDRPGNILELEAKDLPWSVRHKARSRDGFFKRHLLIADNVPLVLAATKGRAKSPNLAPILRSLCAFALAIGSRDYIRWCASELNVADGLSRG
jgi:hypothetical protein